jgi:hypothetical protein
MALASRPASPVRVAALGRSDLLDDHVWSLVGQDVQEARPVEQAEAVHQAGRAVAQDGRSLQATAGNGVGEGVLGSGRIGAGDPEAVGMVAVAALLGDQAAANLPLQRPPEPPSGTLVARTRRARSEGPGHRAAGGR